MSEALISGSKPIAEDASSIIIPDMSLEDLPEGAEYTEYEHTYYSGHKRKIYVVDDEEPYPKGHLIISVTNPQGIITQANSEFIEMSGYDRDEIIGMPHCILRHPDLPSAIFKDMWEHILSDRVWYGYVKNLRKDGRHYWVNAVVNPTYRKGELQAVTSVRRIPSREKVEEAIVKYKQMKSEKQ